MSGAGTEEPVMKHICRTCAKKSAYTDRCRVLKKNIGINRECWAWTDDPQWEEKVRQAVQEYRQRKGASGG